MTHHYIFEDSGMDVLSKLFMRGYRSVPDTFHWVDGASNIFSVIEQYKKDVLYVVYLDLVPDNPHTVMTYNKLKKLVVEQGYKIIVFPSPCAEFYVAKLLLKLNLLPDSEPVRTVLSRSVYYNSSLIETDKDTKFARTYERFCKLLLYKLPYDCASTSSDVIVHPQGRLFYGVDCTCTGCGKIVHPLSLQQKGTELVRLYECPPGESLIGNARRVSPDEAYNTHIAMVDRYNAVVKLYKDYFDKIPNSTGGKKCKSVTYIPKICLETHNAH